MRMAKLCVVSPVHSSFGLLTSFSSGCCRQDVSRYRRHNPFVGALHKGHPTTPFWFSVKLCRQLSKQPSWKQWPHGTAAPIVEMQSGSRQITQPLIFRLIFAHNKLISKVNLDPKVCWWFCRAPRPEGKFSPPTCDASWWWVIEKLSF